MTEYNEKALKYWEQIYAERGTGRIKTDTWLDDFSDLIKACNTPVLDLGCGDGNDTLHLMQMGKIVIAADQSETALGNLRQNIPDVYETRCLNLLNRLPFNDHTFGIVICDLCLHYFTKADTFQILEEIRRVLLPGGHLLFRVNSVNDVNYGACEGIEIEHHLYETEDHRLIRFFDEADIRDMLGTFSIEFLREEIMTRYGPEKHIFRGCAKNNTVS